MISSYISPLLCIRNLSGKSGVGGVCDVLVQWSDGVTRSKTAMEVE
jgi:hypothetical protein